MIDEGFVMNVLLCLLSLLLTQCAFADCPNLIEKHHELFETKNLKTAISVQSDDDENIIETNNIVDGKKSYHTQNDS